MKLIIDIGNSRAKAVVMDGMQPLKELVADGATEAWLNDIVGNNFGISAAIVSSTRDDAEEVCSLLRTMIPHVIHFEPATTPTPIGNDYLTPATLGADRLAAAVGATVLYPESDIMIVDFGTAITIDYVENGRYKGGNISPGVTTRFRALADYTAKLPLCHPTDESLDYGQTTIQAIEQGVMRGVEHEISGYAESFSKKKSENRIIFTGGDAKYFVMRIKNAIFAESEPVILGLNRILDYNAK